MNSCTRKRTKNAGEEWIENRERKLAHGKEGLQKNKTKARTNK